MADKKSEKKDPDPAARSSRRSSSDKGKDSRKPKKSTKKPNPARSGNPAKAAAAERERLEASRSAANRVSRVPTKVKETGSPRWYAPTMVGLLVIGLLWVVTTYLFQGRYPIPYFVEHHASDWLLNGNLYVGFLIMMAGFLGLLRWR